MRHENFPSNLGRLWCYFSISDRLYWKNNSLGRFCCWFEIVNIDYKRMSSHSSRDPNGTSLFAAAVTGQIFTESALSVGV